ncbi:MAG: thiamine phosphate synthase [Myxococcota bacterium]
MIDARARIRGLYGIANAGSGDLDPVAQGVALLKGGCRLIQLRCKGWSTDDIEVAARDLGARCRAQGATFILNDHPELAAAVDADGVHIGQTDGDAITARRALGPHRLLGRSTNHPREVPAALDHADYLAFGPMFETINLSRPKAIQGPALLREVRALVPPSVPLVAIGGLTRDRLVEVRTAGADAWAVISAIARAADPVAETRAWVAA